MQKMRLYDRNGPCCPFSLWTFYGMSEGVIDNVLGNRNIETEKSFPLTSSFHAYKDWGGCNPCKFNFHWIKFVVIHYYYMHILLLKKFTGSKRPPVKETETLKAMSSFRKIKQWCSP